MTPFRPSSFSRFSTTASRSKPQLARLHPGRRRGLGLPAVKVDERSVDLEVDGRAGEGGRLGKSLQPRTTVLSDLDALPLLERWLEERGKLQGGGGGAATILHPQGHAH